MQVLLILAIIWLPAIIAYTVYFSVGEGLGPKKQTPVHLMRPPQTVPEKHPIPHAA